MSKILKNFFHGRLLFDTLCLTQYNEICREKNSDVGDSAVLVITGFSSKADD